MFTMVTFSMLTGLSLTAPQLVRAAEEAGGHSGPNPYLVGGVAFGILMSLLFITTRFNSER
jgi:hypothetical protein